MTKPSGKRRYIETGNRSETGSAAKERGVRDDRSWEDRTGSETFP